jgi:hypothetical protein
MLSIKKSYVVIAGILGGLAIAFQNQLITGWQHLQSQSASIITERQSVNPFEEGSWDKRSDALHTPSKFIPNSSIGNHHRAQDALPSTSLSIAPNRLVSSPLEKNRPSSFSNIPTLRIASFNMQAFGESKLKKSAVMEIISRMMRQFDVIALQHIQSRQQNILPELIDKINLSDRRYDYCIGPQVGEPANQQQFAFIFDTDRIETDRQQLYTVDDPQGLIVYEPLVGWFRSRQAAADQAFTFSLVNLRIDPINQNQEIKLLSDLVRSIRQDGRLEDDVILAGDFGCSDRELSVLQNAGMLFALEGTPTTVTGEAMLDNIVFPARATNEFSGKAGVVDFLRQLNLSIDQAFQVSSHMPVWAEFFAVEGGSPGYIGSRDPK